MYKEIDLKEWIQAGEGGTADSYNKIGDDSLLLKLFHSDRSDSEVLLEYEQVKQIQDFGLQTPKVYEIVRYHDRLGIVFERLVGKVSFSRLCADDPSKIEQYASEYAKESKEFHKKEVNSSVFYDKKEQICKLVASNIVTRKKDSKVILSYLSSLTNRKYALHGDLHTGNLLKVKEKGNYWIDLGDFSYGSYWFDIGTMYLVTKQISWMKLIQDNLHMNKKQLSRFWDGFSSTYFKDDDLERINLKAKIFALIRVCQRIVYAKKGKLAYIICKYTFGRQLVKAIKKYNEYRSKRKIKEDN